MNTSSEAKDLAEKRRLRDDADRSHAHRLASRVLPGIEVGQLLEILQRRIEGDCIRFLIYQLSADDVQLIDIRSALEADFSDDRNLFRANLIKDCQVLYVVSIGGPAAAKVVRAGVYPMKVVDGGEAREVLKKLQTVMHCPPPWLAKILGVGAEERVRFERSEEAAG